MSGWPGVRTSSETSRGWTVSGTTKVAVIYYSSTGTVHQLAESVAAGAAEAGAELRLRRTEELMPEAVIARNEAWVAHRDASAHVLVAQPEDMLWADAVIFGTPTRFGNLSSQLKQFVDSLGPLWGEGLLADKVYSGFTSSSTAHGGQESTLLALYASVHHFGGIIASPGYTDPIKFVDGNPYGTSHVTRRGTNPIAPETMQAAAYQGARVARIATAFKAGQASAASLSASS